jgi:ADP-heptose:LPS heptosyltransferase
MTAAGAQRTGFKDARELNTLFQHCLVKIPVNTEHALEKNLLFAHYLGCPPIQEDFSIHCNQADRDHVISFLQSHGIEDNQLVIYANPAARWETKFWPAHHWAELADRLRAEGMILLFGGSVHDRGYIQKITTQMKSPAVVPAGSFSLPQSVALLKRSRMYIGLDSGPMHMAAMASVPVVALFGPTHPSRVGPYRVAHRIVRAEGLDCLECRKRSCDHVSCMKNISVSMVMAALISLLDETP